MEGEALIKLATGVLSPECRPNDLRNRPNQAESNRLPLLQPPFPGDHPPMPSSTAQQPQDGISGLIERVTYHAEETGFAVLRVKANGHRDLVTVVGSLAAVNAGNGPPPVFKSILGLFCCATNRTVRSFIARFPQTVVVSSYRSGTYTHKSAVNRVVTPNATKRFTEILSATP